MASHSERQIVHIKDVFGEVPVRTGDDTKVESHASHGQQNTSIVTQQRNLKGATPKNTNEPPAQPKVIGASNSGDVFYVRDGGDKNVKDLKSLIAGNGSAKPNGGLFTGDVSKDKPLRLGSIQNRPLPSPPRLDNDPQEPPSPNSENPYLLPNPIQEESQPSPTEVNNGAHLSHSFDIIEKDNINPGASFGQQTAANAGSSSMAHVGTAKQLASRGNNAHSGKAQDFSRQPLQHKYAPSGSLATGPNVGSRPVVVRTGDSGSEKMSSNNKDSVFVPAMSPPGKGSRLQHDTSTSEHSTGGRDSVDQHQSASSEKDSDYLSSIGSAYCHSEVSGTTSSASGYYSEDVASELVNKPGASAVLDTATMRKSNPLLYDGLGDDDDDGGDDGFAEDVCTLDFEDDEEGAAGAVDAGQTLVYREYYGEDFAQYLEDDPLDEEPSPKVPLPHELSTYARQRKKAASKQKGGKRKSGYSQNANGELTSVSDSSGGANRSNGIKDKITQVFTLGRSHNKNKNRGGNHLSKIYDFSYSDSKIANEPRSGSSSNGASSTDTNTTTSSRQGRYKKKSQNFSSHSDFGTMSNSGSWWGTSQEDLSNGAKHRGSQSEIMTSSSRTPKSNSVPNLKDFNKDSRQSNGHSDVELRHQNGGKNGKVPSSSSSSSKSKNTLWRRFSRSLQRKEDKVEYIVDDNKVSSQLQSASSFEDVRL